MIQQLCSNICNASLPTTHPYISEIRIDPAYWIRFANLAQGRPEVIILNCCTTMPDHWTISVACASAEVMKRLEDAWA